LVWAIGSVRGCSGISNNIYPPFLKLLENVESTQDVAIMLFLIEHASAASEYVGCCMAKRSIATVPQKSLTIASCIRVTGVNNATAGDKALGNTLLGSSSEYACMPRLIVGIEGLLAARTRKVPA
jgi:hypothetical protein